MLQLAQKWHSQEICFGYQMKQDAWNLSVGFNPIAFRLIQVGIHFRELLSEYFIFIEN